MSEDSGDKIICVGCIYHYTDKCKKWLFWKSVCAEYAKSCCKNGKECKDKKK